MARISDGTGWRWVDGEEGTSSLKVNVQVEQSSSPDIVVERSPTLVETERLLEQIAASGV